MMKSPMNLVDCSVSHLVQITFRALRKFEAENNVRNKISEEEYSSNMLSRKRKLVNDIENELETRQRKKIRRKSYDSVDVKTERVQYISPSRETVSKDDCFIKGCSLVDAVIILKNYFKCLPQNLWNTFFCSVLNALNDLEVDTNSTVEYKTLELLFSKHVSSFSTKLICRDVYDKCEHLIYERIYLCRNLKSLYIHYNVQADSMDVFLSSVDKLNQLRCICLVPETKQSFHLAIPVIAKHSKYLEELSVVYHCELFSKIDNISCLITCKKLRNLKLYSYGKGTETEHIKQLLYNLNDLVCFFHRELPHALIDIAQHIPEVYIFKLKVLLLATYCKGVGSHLCYLPNDSLVRIGSVCPFISQISVVKPLNLSEIVDSFPSLTKLNVHDCEFEKLMNFCLERKSWSKIVSLNLWNTEYIDYDCIILISNSCTQLQELEIVHSNVFISNGIHAADKRAFPELRKLRIQKFSFDVQKEPKFVYPHTMIINNSIFKYLLSGTAFLEQLYLEFDTETMQYRESNILPSEEELISYISTCKELKDLMLISCPKVTYQMISVIVRSCPNLQHLWDVDLWKIPSNEMDLILKQYSHLFIQSFERSIT